MNKKWKKFVFQPSKKGYGSVQIKRRLMENRIALAKGRRVIWTCAFLLVFASSLLYKFSSPLVIFLWIFSCGAFGAYLFFWYNKRAPNVLIHLFPPLQEILSPSVPPPLPPVTNIPRDGVWKSKPATLPENVNLAIEEFLEIALEKFVYKWERDLLKSEAVVDEVRQGLQHIAQVIVQRVQNLDVPTLILKKMTKVLAAHLHQYMSARMVNRRLSFEPMDNSLSKFTLGHKRYAVHWTLRGELTDQEYCQKVLSAILPLVLPPEIMESKLVCSFLENLLIMKIALPALNFVAKPDIINKFLLLLVDRKSRMEKGYGPLPRSVLPLGTLSLRRHVQRCPLALKEAGILKDQDRLYRFISFLKEQGSVQFLQSLLTLNTLVANLQSLLSCGEENTKEHASSLLQELRKWRQSHVQKSLGLVDTTHSNELGQVLQECRHPMVTLHTIHTQGLLLSLQDQLNSVLEQKYIAAYCQSDELLAKHFGPRKAVPVSKPASLKQEKYMQRLIGKKKASNSPLLQPRSLSVEDIDPGSISDDSLSTASEEEEGKTLSSYNHRPLRVQIVDHVTCTEGALLSSYTVYVIVTRQEDVSPATGGGGGPRTVATEDCKAGPQSTATVKRRYKEFVALDDKLQQFYGTLGVSLPPRRTVGNRNRDFLAKRKLQLEQYLMELIRNPKTRDNHLLLSFLTGLSAQFVPPSRAGKVFKSVPQMLKKEKGKNLDVYLKNLAASTEHPAVTTGLLSLEGVFRDSPIKREMDRHQSSLEKDRASLLSGVFDLPETIDPVPSVTGLYELLLFIAKAFYKVPSFALFLLSSFKFVGEKTMNALARRFVEDRVEALTYDQNLIHLIHLLRDNVLLNPSGPRSTEEIAERQKMALNEVTNRPPEFLIHLAGREKHEWAMWMLFMSVQSHRLNKQLCYGLLDLIVLELFPELDEESLS